MAQTAGYREEGHYAVLNEPRGMGVPQIMDSWGLGKTAVSGGIYGRYPMMLPEGFVRDSLSMRSCE
jgi:hypothetical protein